MNIKDILYGFSNKYQYKNTLDCRPVNMLFTLIQFDIDKQKMRERRN